MSTGVEAKFLPAGPSAVYIMYGTVINNEFDNLLE